MDDGLKITNDKRHRSSSSLVAAIEGSRSERKLDIRASIPEVDDQFANAEARCEDLQEKIDLVKILRRKKKLKKRSMTTIAEPAPMDENTPFIKVRAQPKKKVSQQAARIRRLEMPQKTHNSMRGYLDPDLIEQHQMLGRVHGFHDPTSDKNKQFRPRHETVSLPKARRHADGDAMCGQGVQKDVPITAQEVACGNQKNSYNYLDEKTHHGFTGLHTENKERRSGRDSDGYQQSKESSKTLEQHMPWMDESRDTWGLPPSASMRHRPKSYRNQDNNADNVNEKETRPVVELFKKSQVSPEPWQRVVSSSTVGANIFTKTVGSNEEGRETVQRKDRSTFKTKKIKVPRALKKFRYELPTVSSKMKQAGTRYCADSANTSNIPFVVSKSTAPSHNVGANVQKVLNGLKTKQPLSGIPLTIAHHMGLRHYPSNGSNSPKKLSLRNSEMNAIKVGGRWLRLSNHMSFSRLLSLYQEGDGIVPRFLKAVSRPRYFYTSEYNLVTNHENFDAATSKGRISSEVAKRSLATYANLYREYQDTEKSLFQKYDAKVAIRLEQLARKLDAGEEYIRKVVQEYGSGEEVPLRETSSIPEDGYRHSTLHEDV